MKVRSQAAWILFGAWGIIGTAAADPPQALFKTINEYRTNGDATCAAARQKMAAPLGFDKRLTTAARLLAKGKTAESALQAAKFQGGPTSIIYASGRNADEALANARRQFCATLLQPGHTLAGIAFHKGRWWIVLSSRADAPSAQADARNSKADALPAETTASLDDRISGYRAAGDRECNGGMRPAPPFKADPKVQAVTRLLAEGKSIDAARQSTDLNVDRFAYYSFSSADPDLTFDWLRSKLCETVLDPGFTHFAAARADNGSWLLFTSAVLAEAVPVNPKPAQQREQMQKMLELVNEARSHPRTCGNKGHFDPVGPLEWNDKLGKSALLHSEDMAKRNFFSHVTPEGMTPGQRIERQGYVAAAAGENIAVGQQTVE